MRYDIVYLTLDHHTGHTEQELSYRKQIVRQLRRQYIEGIYSLNITP